MSIDIANYESHRTVVRLFSEWAEGASEIVDTENFCAFKPAQSFDKLDEIKILLQTLGVEGFLQADEGESVNFNKKDWKDKGILFFLTADSLKSWVTSLDPFKSSNFVFSPGTKVVIANGLPKHYLGPTINILSSEHNEICSPRFGPSLDRLPNQEQVHERVHVIGDNLCISPISVNIDFPEFSSPIAVFQRLAILHLAAPLASELRNGNTIILRGIRRVSLSFTSQNDFASDSIELLTALVNANIWISEEGSDTRHKLIVDRLSLDAAENSTFISILKSHLPSAVQDAKDKYKFIVSNQIDDYTKDLRAIQLQIATQVQAYSEKVRTLVGNLLRDILAALLLVGLGLLNNDSKLSIPSLIENRSILFLFKGLGMFFIISFLFQASVVLIDLAQSKGELLRFVLASRSYMSESDIRLKLKENLKWRQRFFWGILSLNLILYSLIALVCFWLKEVMEFLLFYYPIEKSVPLG